MEIHVILAGYSRNENFFYFDFFQFSLVTLLKAQMLSVHSFTQQL